MHSDLERLCIAFFVGYYSPPQYVINHLQSPCKGVTILYYVCVLGGVTNWGHHFYCLVVFDRVEQSTTLHSSN